VDEEKLMSVLSIAKDLLQILVLVLTAAKLVKTDKKKSKSKRGK
jgi:hypothetical protein